MIKRIVQFAIELLGTVDFDDPQYSRERFDVWRAVEVHVEQGRALPWWVRR